MQSAEMRQFRHLVFTRAEVREALCGHASDQEFVSATLALAQTFEINLGEDEVREALSAGQREWLERWL